MHLESFQHRFRFGVLVLALSLQFTFPKIFQTCKSHDKLFTDEIYFIFNMVLAIPLFKRKVDLKFFFLSNLMFKHVCFHFLAHKPRTLVLKLFLFSRQWVFVIWSLFRIICHLFMSDVRNFFYSNMPTLFDFLILKTRAQAHTTEARI